jgi:hypothetical protein
VKCEGAIDRPVADPQVHGLGLVGATPRRRDRELLITADGARLGRSFHGSPKHLVTGIANYCALEGGATSGELRGGSLQAASPVWLPRWGAVEARTIDPQTFEEGAGRLIGAFNEDLGVVEVER